MRRMTFMWNKVLVFICSIVLVAALTAAVELTAGIPSIFNSTESAFQAQTHFLVTTGSDSSGETAATSTNYYNAIDPAQSKRTFAQWLVNAGFIDDVSHWHPTGPQIIACDLGPQNGCDIPAHNPDGSLNYGPGDNVINTDSHVTVLNAGDLGFVRYQFIRCIPSCTATNPKVYTYLENYPVNPFARSGAGGSGFPIHTGYPDVNEAAAAIKSAVNRPLGKLAGCSDTAPNIETDTILGCSIERIADVAFEWAPPETNPTSSTRIGTLYAFVFSDDGGGIGDAVHTQETIAVPASLVNQDPANDLIHVTPNLVTKTLNPIKAGDPFPPNLDFLGFKEHPGNCLICHGGTTSSTGTYGTGGKIDGFRFLPIDIRNMLFTSDSGGEQPAAGSLMYTDRSHQEAQIKEYNQAVLYTVPSRMQTDEQGVTRLPHLREVIQGWYAGGSSTQNTEFVPVGWSGVPANERLYTTVVATTCRSCHFNRELSLDFGTVANFDSYKSDILQYVLQPLCSQSNPQKGGRPMPLAHLTYQRFWQASNATGQYLPYPAPALQINDTGDQIAQHFGYASEAAYCATIH